MEPFLHDLHSWALVCQLNVNNSPNCYLDNRSPPIPVTENNFRAKLRASLRSRAPYKADRAPDGVTLATPKDES